MLVYITVAAWLILLATYNVNFIVYFVKKLNLNKTQFLWITWQELSAIVESSVVFLKVKIGLSIFVNKLKCTIILPKLSVTTDKLEKRPMARTINTPQITYSPKIFKYPNTLLKVKNKRCAVLFCYQKLCKRPTQYLSGRITRLLGQGPVAISSTFRLVALTLLRLCWSPCYVIGHYAWRRKRTLAEIPVYP